MLRFWNPYLSRKSTAVSYSYIATTLLLYTCTGHNTMQKTNLNGPVRSIIMKKGHIHFREDQRDYSKLQHRPSYRPSYRPHGRPFIEMCLFLQTLRGHMAAIVHVEITCHEHVFSFSRDMVCLVNHILLSSPSSPFSPTYHSHPSTLFPPPSLFHQ